MGSRGTDGGTQGRVEQGPLSSAGGTEAARSARLCFPGGEELEADDFWMFLEELEAIHHVRGELSDKEFEDTCRALRRGMGQCLLGERPPKEVLARRRADRFGCGEVLGPSAPVPGGANGPGQLSGPAAPTAGSPTQQLREQRRQLGHGQQP